MSYYTTPNQILNNTPSFTLTWTDNFIRQNGTYSLYFNNGSDILIEDGQYVSDGEIIFSSTSQFLNGSYTVRVVNTDNPLTYNVTSQNNLDITCFCEGTEILCEDDKYEKIENLKIGQKIKVYNGEPKKILFIYSKNYKNDNTYHKICKLSGYENQTKDLFLTGGHSILVDELSEKEIKDTYTYWNDLQKIEDKYLLLSCVNEKSDKIDDENTYKVYHIVLESNDKTQQFGIYSNGILSESMSINCYEIMTKNNMLTIL